MVTPVWPQTPALMMVICDVGAEDNSIWVLKISGSTLELHFEIVSKRP